VHRTYANPALTGVLLTSIYLLDCLALWVVSEHVPFCPERLIGHVGSGLFCRSYLWGALVHGVMQLLAFSAVLELCFRHRLAIKWHGFASALPLLYLLIMESTLAKEAMDTVSPLGAEKVELNRAWDPAFACGMLAFCFSLILIGHLLRMRKRLH
jgi:hypothetical protein